VWNRLKITNAAKAEWVRGFWEHQALTRARFCVGDVEIGKKFETLREEILQLPRDWNNVKKEVITMRQKNAGWTPQPHRAV
jgi:glutamine synthetase adenylyltransferase